MLPPSLVSIVAVHWRSVRVGRGRFVWELVVGLSGPLTPRQATRPAAYRLSSPGRDGIFGTRDDRRVPLAAPRYHAADHSVRLRLATRAVPRGSLRLVIDGSKILDAKGRSLDADGDRQPGGKFAQVVEG